MLTAVTLVSAGGSTLAVNDLTYPLQHFTWNPVMIGAEQAKMEAAGSYNNWKRVQKMAIEMEGHIVSDTATGYWTARKALLAIITPTEPQTNRIHGSVRVQVVGDGATYYMEVVLEDYEVPMEALYPTVTPFQFQWSGNFGYWRRMSDNVVVPL